jgi:hypothetical protein
LRKGGLIIEGTITTIVIIGFEVVLGLIIFAYAFYITFYPYSKLFKTIFRCSRSAVNRMCKPQSMRDTTLCSMPA